MMQKQLLIADKELTEDFEMTRLVDVPEAQINVVRLKAGKELPAHNANSNVRLLVMDGGITVTAEGDECGLATHEMVSVAHGSFMQIRNVSDGDAAFLVIKVPNPVMLSSG